ncbi:hypothetical protein GCM10010116_43630 [Microbispora rosea subsp. aerata]|nr:hypothetical protein [Microbispora rosea]GGO21666.1 hypothetical protein GCM10010116_43630 [Microbispora rosea subsp. aerata]GLJ84135.1 hypothetical protein GCM10017588_28630 [Microbispora rosea subsp. aerata]
MLFRLPRPMHPLHPIGHSAGDAIHDEQQLFRLGHAEVRIAGTRRQGQRLCRLTNGTDQHPRRPTPGTTPTSIAIRVATISVGTTMTGTGTTGTIAAGRRASTRIAIRDAYTSVGTNTTGMRATGMRATGMRATGMDTTGTVAVGRRVGIPLAGISTGTSASAGTCAIIASRVGIGATGAGSRAVGTPATSALALTTGRRAADGEAVPVAGSGSRAIGTAAATAGTGAGPVIGDGGILGSVADH